MATADDMRKKYFTEDGEKALFARLNTLIKLYEGNTTYPFKQKMLGFVPIVIYSKEGLLHMINELRQVLGLEKVVLKTNDHGRQEIIEVK